MCINSTSNLHSSCLCHCNNCSSSNFLCCSIYNYLFQQFFFYVFLLLDKTMRLIAGGCGVTLILLWDGCTEQIIEVLGFVFSEFLYTVKENWQLKATIAVGFRSLFLLLFRSWNGFEKISSFSPYPYVFVW